MEQIIGLLSKQVQKLLTQFGYNEIAGRPRQTPFQILLSQFTSVLDDNKIEKIITFLRDMPKLWGAFDLLAKKQFMRWFIKTVWVQQKKVVGIDYTDGLQDCINRDLVRIKTNWLPRYDSNVRHPRYKSPSVTKRFGLSHYPRLNVRDSGI